MRSDAAGGEHDKTAASLSRRENTFLSLVETEIERRFEMPFRKTHPFDGDYINARHEDLAGRRHASGMIDFGVDGWLLPADALKLYEMAYCCDGDILELGAYRGLSAAIMNEACNDSHRSNKIISIDLDPSAVELSRQELEGRPGGRRVSFFQGDAGEAVRNLAGIKRQFRFAFVDHSNRYEHVLDACRSLHRVMAVEGFALFHDFNDPRNGSESDHDYGVYQGVLDGLKIGRWEFWGIYGCSWLFRHVDHGERSCGILSALRGMSPMLVEIASRHPSILVIPAKAGIQPRAARTSMLWRLDSACAGMTRGERD